MIPVEVGLPSMRIMGFPSYENDRLMTKKLDFLEENREIAFICLVDYQQKLSRGYNRNVRPREFIARDLVWRRVLRSIKEPSLGKLASNWEDPYCETTVAKTRAYYLEDLEERLLPHPWNASNLKKYFYKLLSSLTVSNSLSYVYCSKFVYSYSTLHKCPISRSRNVRWGFRAGRKMGDTG